MELTRIELVTSCMPCKRSPKLSYSPKNLKIRQKICVTIAFDFGVVNICLDVK